MLSCNYILTVGRGRLCPHDFTVTDKSRRPLFFVHLYGLIIRSSLNNPQTILAADNWWDHILRYNCNTYC